MRPARLEALTSDRPVAQNKSLPHVAHTRHGACRQQGPGMKRSAENEPPCPATTLPTYRANTMRRADQHQPRRADRSLWAAIAAAGGLLAMQHERQNNSSAMNCLPNQRAIATAIAYNDGRDAPVRLHPAASREPLLPYAASCRSCSGGRAGVIPHPLGEAFTFISPRHHHPVARPDPPAAPALPHSRTAGRTTATARAAVYRLDAQQ